MNHVPLAPCMTASIGPASVVEFAPSVMRVEQPAVIAIRAASSLVAMPPEPTPALAFAPPAIATISGVSLWTSGICFAPGLARGSAS